MLTGVQLGWPRTSLASTTQELPAVPARVKLNWPAGRPNWPLSATIRAFHGAVGRPPNVAVQPWVPCR